MTHRIFSSEAELPTSDRLFAANVQQFAPRKRPVLPFVLIGMGLFLGLCAVVGAG